MVKKTKKGQLLWIAASDGVLYGHVSSDKKDVFGKRKITMRFGDSPVGEETDFDYHTVWAGPDSFHYTRQEAIKELIKDLKSKEQHIQKCLEILQQELPKVHTKNIELPKS